MNQKSIKFTSGAGDSIKSAAGAVSDEVKTMETTPLSNQIENQDDQEMYKYYASHGLIPGESNHVARTTYRPNQPAQARQPKVYPFYRPTLFLPDWVKNKGVDLAYAGGQYVAFPGDATNKPADRKAADEETLFIDIRVYKELEFIWEWAAKNCGEIAWFMPTHRLNMNSRHWLAWGYYLTGQEASGGEVEMSGPDSARYWKWLSGKRDENEEMPEYGEYEHKDVFSGDLQAHMTHGHKHPQGVRSWSGTDMKQQTNRDQLGQQSSYRWYFLYTPPHYLKASLVVYQPTMFRVEDARLGLYIPETGAPDLTRDRKREITKMLEDLVEKKTYTASSWQNSNWQNNNWQNSWQAGNYWDNWREPAWRRNLHRDNTRALPRDIPGGGTVSDDAPERMRRVGPSMSTEFGALKIIRDYLLDHLKTTRRRPEPAELLEIVKRNEKQVSSLEYIEISTMILRAQDRDMYLQVLGALLLFMNDNNLVPDNEIAVDAILDHFMSTVEEMLSQLDEGGNWVVHIMDAFAEFGYLNNLKLSQYLGIEDFKTDFLNLINE